MMKIRSVHPEFFQNPDLGELSPFLRLTFIGLACMADDCGIYENDYRKLLHRIHGFDDEITGPQMRDALEQLEASGYVRSYQFGSNSYGAVKKFLTYQMPSRPHLVHPLPADRDERNSILAYLEAATVNNSYLKNFKVSQKNKHDPSWIAELSECREKGIDFPPEPPPPTKKQSLSESEQCLDTVGTQPKQSTNIPSAIATAAVTDMDDDSGAENLEFSVPNVGETDPKNDGFEQNQSLTDNKQCSDTDSHMCKGRGKGKGRGIGGVGDNASANADAGTQKKSSSNRSKRVTPDRVVELYNEIISAKRAYGSTVSGVRAVSKYSASIAARQRAIKDTRDEDWWASYFNYVTRSRFLMGLKGDGSWSVSLEFLLKPSNMEKVCKLQAYHKGADEMGFGDAPWDADDVKAQNG